MALNSFFTTTVTSERLKLLTVTVTMGILAYLQFTNPFESQRLLGLERTRRVEEDMKVIEKVAHGTRPLLAEDGLVIKQLLSKNAKIESLGSLSIYDMTMTRRFDYRHRNLSEILNSGHYVGILTRNHYDERQDFRKLEDNFKKWGFTKKVILNRYNLYLANESGPLDSFASLGSPEN